MSTFLHRVVAAIAFTATFALAAARTPAQDDAEAAAPDAASPKAIEAKLRSLDPKIEWQIGPCEAKVGDVATVPVPKGLAFTGKEGSKRFLTAMENLTSGAELATVVALDGSYWFACFEYAASGHVKDDDKSELDAKALLEKRQEGADESNQERKRRGYPELHVVGWAVPPHYDEGTHNLEWGLKLSGGAEETINYEVRLLSRVGFVQSMLVCSPDQVDVALPKFRALLSGFEFVRGQHYNEVKPGDPIADLTLTALVAGGAAVVAWKFGKLLKPLLVAVFGAGAAFWKKLTGKGRTVSRSAGPPPAGP